MWEVVKAGGLMWQYSCHCVCVPGSPL